MAGCGNSSRSQSDRTAGAASASLGRRFFSRNLPTSRGRWRSHYELPGTYGAGLAREIPELVKRLAEPHLPKRLAEQRRERRTAWAVEDDENLHVEAEPLEPEDGTDHDVDPELAKEDEGLAA